MHPHPETQALTYNEEVQLPRTYIPHLITIQTLIRGRALSILPQRLLILLQKIPRAI